MSETRVNPSSRSAELLRVLEEEDSVYCELLALMEAEYQAIVTARIDELTDLLINKERLLSRAEALEVERLDRVRELVGNAEAEGSRLEEIAPLLASGERDHLLSLRDSLHQNIDLIGTANQRNDLLLRSGLQIVGKWLNLLASYATAGVTYAPDGSAAPQRGQRLLDRQA